jgi:hypothetical protein
VTLEFIGQIEFRVLICTKDEAPTLMDTFIEKTIRYTDIPGISRMMKGYSSRAVYDKMDGCLVEKKSILFHRSSSYSMGRQRLFLILLKWGQA